MDQIADTLLPTLEELALHRFEDLTAAELKLLRALPGGVPAHCGDPTKGLDDQANDPKRAGTWGTDHEIRAALIRWLCVDQEARQRIDPNGIAVWCARVSGPLDLSFLSVSVPLALLRCSLTGQMSLVHADLRILTLNGTHAQAIQADGLRARGDVILADGFRAGRKVSLIGAEIGGSLFCFGGHFRGVAGENQPALVADGARVNGSVFLHRVRVDGEVSLAGARIGGNLECDAASIVGAMEDRQQSAKIRGKALQMAGAQVEGHVFFRNGFSAEGEVNLMGVKVGGSLDCTGGSFCGDVQILPNGKRTVGIAIDATGAVIGESMFLRNGFRAEGESRLLGMEIGSNLVLEDAALPRSLLNAQRTTIKGVLMCTGLRSKDTRVNLMGVSAGVLADKREGWPDPGKLHLDGFTYGRFLRSETDAKTRLHWLRLQLRRKERDRVGSFRPQPYQHLARVLRDQGEDEEARKILIALEDDRRKYGELSRLSRWWAWILKCTIAYGYRPMRALWFIGAFVAMGFVVFGSAYRAGELVPSDKQAFEDRANRKATPYYEGFCAMAYAVDAFVPIIDLGQRSKWQPIGSGDAPLKPAACESSESLECTLCQAAMFADGPSFAPWFVRLFRWLDIIAGWFFTSLLVAGVSRLVRSH